MTITSAIIPFSSVSSGGGGSIDSITGPSIIYDEGPAGGIMDILPLTSGNSFTYNVEASSGTAGGGGGALAVVRSPLVVWQDGSDIVLYVGFAGQGTNFLNGGYRKEGDNANYAFTLFATGPATPAAQNMEEMIRWSGIGTGWNARFTDVTGPPLSVTFDYVTTDMVTAGYASGKELDSTGATTELVSAGQSGTPWIVPQLSIAAAVIDAPTIENAQEDETFRISLEKSGETTLNVDFIFNFSVVASN